MRLFPGPPKESEATQEGSNSFVLANISRSACVLHGYPRVTLYHDARRLHFTFVPGDGFDVTTRPPRSLLLKPGVQAFFEVAKTGCNGPGFSSTRIRVSLPGGGSTNMAMSPEDRLDYCSHSGPGAGAQAKAGDHPTVSPIVAAPDEVSRGAEA
jgi:hypothetical protein